MKVKQEPDDFQVEEQTDVIATSDGSFALYRLEKTGWTTIDALASVRRRWKIDHRRLSYGGLKDRHARTVQYFTIHNGPQRDLAHHTIAVRYLGQAAAPFTSADIRTNRFRITIRSLAPGIRPETDRRLAEMAGQGVPNYFDDQRFGSVAGPAGEFIAWHLVHGRFEERCAKPSPRLMPSTAPRSRRKRRLSESSGATGRCARPSCRADMPAAWWIIFACIRETSAGPSPDFDPNLRGLYLSAYQSHLWNRILARWLTDHAKPEQLRMIPLRLGPVPFHSGLDSTALETLTSLSLPLPSSRWKPEAGDPRLSVVESVLAEDGLTLNQMQVRGVRELFFLRGERPALCRPVGLSGEWGDDERKRGKLRLTLCFDLPRGSYATLIVKALTG